MAEGPCREASSPRERPVSARARDSPSAGDGTVFGVRTRWHGGARRSRPARPAPRSPEPPLRARSAPAPAEARGEARGEGTGSRGQAVPEGEWRYRSR